MQSLDVPADDGHAGRHAAHVQKTCGSFSAGGGKQARKPPGPRCATRLLGALVLFFCLVCRIGEAANPGPKSSTGAKVITANVTGREGLYRLIDSTGADVLLVQEHKFLQAEISVAREKVFRMGWRSVWAAAESTEAGSRSGGVCILARRAMGLWQPRGSEAVLHKHRAVWAVLSGNGLPMINLYCLYLHSGEGPTDRNMKIVAKVGRHALSYDRGWMVGADWDISPATLAATGITKSLMGVVLHGDEDVGTCTAANPPSTLDFFLVHKSLALVMGRVEVLINSPIKTHRPVQAEWCPDAAGKCVLAMVPQKVPCTRVFGPLPKPPRWQQLIVKARHFENQLRDKAGVEGWSPDLSTREFEEATEMLSSLHREWNAVARQELAGVVGVEPDKVDNLGEVLTRKETVLGNLKGGRKATKKDSTGSDWAGATLRELAKGLLKLTSCEGEQQSKIKNSLVQRVAGLIQLKPSSMPFRQDESLKGNAKDVKAAAKLARNVLRGYVFRYDAIKEVALEIETMADCWESKAKESRTAEDEQKKRDFEVWVEETTSGGACLGHAAAKNMPHWRGTTVMTGDGESGRSCNILEGQRKAWAKIWGATDLWQGDDIGWSKLSVKMLSRIDVGLLRRASKEFKVKTVATDGWHPRHFSLLSQAALTCLASLMNAVELLGVFPSMVSSLLVALLEKPDGGLRPIGLYRALVRLWARCRRGDWARWESTHDSQQAFSSGSNRSATDVVWRQAFRNEAAVAEEEHAATVLIDLVKCYEHVGHARMVREGMAHDFPMVLLKITLQSYRWQRRLTLSGHLAEGLWPTTGIVAGCAAATTELKLYMMSAVVTCVARHPQVKFSVFVDDIGLDGQGRKGDVIENLVNAAKATFTHCEDDVGLPISTKKLVVVASNHLVGETIARRLGNKSAHCAHARNLGVGFRAATGNRKGKCASSKRWDRGVARARRGNKVVRKSRGGAAKLFMTGALPMLGYGAEVFGVPCHKVSQARRLAKASCSGVARGGSLPAAMALCPRLDPAVRLVEAPIVRHATDIWHASEASQARPNNLKLGLIVSGARSVLAKRMAKGKKTVSGRGPISAMIDSAEALGWQVHNPLTLLDEQGNEVRLNEGSPARLRKVIRERIRRQQEEEALEAMLAKGLATVHEFQEMREKGIDWSSARSAINSKKVSWETKVGLKRAVTDSVTTAPKLAKMGYVVDEVCPLCRDEVDSIFHRAWVCPKRPGAEGQDAEVVAAAREAGPQSILYSRGLACHGIPQSWARSPAQARKTANWMPFDPADGPVYHDGSCYDSATNFARAGWAAVQMKDSGEPLKVLWGNVPPELEQPANFAEHYGFLSAMQEAKPQCEFVTDCSTIQGAWDKGLKWAAGPRRPHGGIWREAADLISRERGPKEVSKVKAHQDEASEGLDDRERARIKGNAAADEWAKLGVDMHVLDGRKHREGLMAAKWASRVARELGAVLAGWPGTFELFGELTKRGKVQSAADGEKGTRSHHFAWFDGRRRCQDCWLLPRRAEHECKSKCAGVPSGIVSILKDPKGHDLRMARTVESDLTTLWCATCGAFATTVPRELRKPCRGKAFQSGHLWLKAFRKGMHPLSGEVFNEYFPVLSHDVE